jgi:hypothetical protein
MQAVADCNSALSALTTPRDRDVPVNIDAAIRGLGYGLQDTVVCLPAKDEMPDADKSPGGFEGD